MKKTVLWIVAVVALLVLGNGIYAYLNNTTNTKRITVSTFNDGEDGYAVAIPTGNTSTCIWNYVDGNTAIPNSEITEVHTAEEKHIVYAHDYHDWIVTCIDNLDNHYTGIFPKD